MGTGHKVDLTGKRFGRLTVLWRDAGSIREKKYHCQCDCGGSIVAAGDRLRSGQTKSCGCIKAEAMRDRFLVHGLSDTKEYYAWAAAVKRCENPDHPQHHRYGARGIKMCQRWRGSFEAFLQDMGPAPEGMTLDRYPDNDGDYEPGNCRWATQTEQMRNTRHNRVIEHNGERLCVAEWSERLGISKSVITARLNAGLTPDRVLSHERQYLGRKRKLLQKARTEIAAMLRR